MKNSKRLLTLAVSAAIAAPMSAFATNGMNMEGYGPIATGMGGASMAYDNGTAAMMNNPATLSMMDEGNRLDVAIGELKPDVQASYSDFNMKWDSQSDSFLMPAVGWAKKEDKLTYGVGGFAQGGMGTEYKSTSPGASFVFAGGMHPYGGSSGNPYTPLASGQNITDATLQGQVAGWEEMSEVGVMRILFPVSYMVNDKLNVGGSIDYVRATMDLKMVMTGAMMSDMMNPAAQNIGTMSGSMVNLLDGWMQAGAISDIYGAQFDFADSNPYSGKTEGDGFAGKIGFTYQVNSKLTIGGTYHSETSLSDLTGNATANMAVNSVPFGGEVLVPLKGKIKIKDFQWPSTIGIGLAYQVNDKTKIAADVKKINWSDVMKDFKMSFTAGGNTGGAAAFNGYTMDAVMYQNWDDQTVYELGVSHQLNEAWVLRAGANVANNPIPDATMHYLFPAIVETHYTAGFGYTVSDKDEVNFSATYAPEVEQKNDMGLTVSHSQTNWQLMYSHSF